MNFPCNRDEIAAIVEAGELSDDQFDRLYEHFLSNGEMPYGVAKARTGDPHNWIFRQLENML